MSSDTPPFHSDLPLLLEEPVQHLLDLLGKNAPRILVAVAGVPGSGKSTLAARLSEAVNQSRGKDTMVSLGMDGFHLSKEKLCQMPDPESAFRRRGAPWTFDLPTLAARLREVRQYTSQQSVWWPDFQHDQGDPIEAVHEISATTRLVLVEGLYLLYRDEGWEEVYRQFDEHWFLDTAPEVTLERLTARHMKAWNISREEAQHRIAINDQLNANLVATTRMSAQWRVEDGT